MNHKTLMAWCINKLRPWNILFVSLLLAACAEDAHKNSGSLNPSASPNVVPSINTAPQLLTGVHTISVKGLTRTFILYVPESFNPKTKTPLLIDFHGLFGNGAGQMESSGYKAVSDSEGILVAFPDGIDKAWNIGPCCTFSREVDDVAFAHAIVEQVKLEANVDESRIYAAGFSNGGGMTQYLGCHAADLFAAIAPSAFDLLEENSNSCLPARPIPVLLTRGLADNFVTYAGGPSNPPNGLPTTIHFMGAVATFNRWAELNHCSAVTVTDSSGCNIHTKCDGGVQVGLCSVVGGGHSPGDAKTGWDFLKRFKKN